MDRLWTPWRFDYIRGIADSEGCVFCRILAEDRDRDNFLLCRREHAFAILNLYPYTSGHILIVANRHIPFLRDAQTAELHEFLEIARRCEIALQAEYKPEGFNLGFNLGKAAGAGVAYHLHMHIVPRWFGDTNFVTVVGETRILPEEMHRTYERILPHLQK